MCWQWISSRPTLGREQKVASLGDDKPGNIPSREILGGGISLLHDGAEQPYMELLYSYQHLDNQNHRTYVEATTERKKQRL